MRDKLYKQLNKQMNNDPTIKIQKEEIFTKDFSMLELKEAI